MINTVEIRDRHLAHTLYTRKSMRILCIPARQINGIHKEYKQKGCLFWMSEVEGMCVPRGRGGGVRADTAYLHTEGK